MSSETSPKKRNLAALWVVIPLAFFVVLAILLSTAIGENPDLIPSARKGDPVPAFQLPSLLHQGKTVTPAIFKGHWTLLNVWATWCPTCHVEHSVLLKLASKGVRIVGMDYKDTDAKARQWLATKGNPYVEVFVDRSGDYGLNLGVYGAPETYLVNPQGQILMRHVGNVTLPVWREKIKPLIDAAKGGTS